MKLITKELLKKLPELNSTENIPPNEKELVCKFFTPDSSWTWYACEFDQAEGLFYGLVEGHNSEWGYFTLQELETTTGPWGLHIERDLYFDPVKFGDFT